MISDPRQYTIDYPKSNMIINQALQVLSGSLNHQELEVTLSGFLKKNNDALINVALNLAPSCETSSLIWQALNNSINPNGISGIANVFAVPLILVAGSKNKAQLSSELDVEKLNTFFNDCQIFQDNFDCFISGKLLDPQVIAKLKPSQLYHWSYNLQKSKLWLPIEVSASSIQVQNEGVFLRFLVGVTVNNEIDSGLNLEAFRNNSMSFMQYILSELKADGVTLFPIPMPPIPLSKAFWIGNNYRQEIAIQVACSNIVKKIRQNSLTPNAMIGTSGEAIKITITSRESSEFVEESLWHLTKFDDFSEKVNKIVSLFQDMQLEWQYESRISG